jgi:hypothetical protein
VTEVTAVDGVSRDAPEYLRHTFCALLIREKASIAEVARQTGRACEEVEATNRRLLMERRDAEPVSAAGVIGLARARLAAHPCA